MTTTTYVYIFDYSSNTIDEIEIEHVREDLQSEEIESVLDFNFGYHIDEIEYMISKKKLNITYQGKAYA